MAEVVVVTGASAGVGRAVARRFAREGAAVGLLARGEDGLQGARKDVEREGGRALVVPTDVSDANGVEAAARSVEEKLGPIDVWVNNAMTTVFGPFQEISAEEYRRVTEVTYLGYVHGTMSALRRMVPRYRGVVVQVGSALAYRGIPLQSAYCGSKHAIKGFTESVQTELRHDGSGVRVTMVHMPGLNTPQFGLSRNKMPRRALPVPPIYQPELAADAVLWASRHRRREVYVGTPSVGTILGNKPLFGVVERYLARTGYESQQTTEPEDPDRPDYLEEPVPGDRGAHGSYDGMAHRHDPQFWVTKNRRWIALAGLAGAALLALKKT